jgi:hypothetical protein
VAVHAHTVDFLDLVAEEVGNVLVRGPVDRHAELVAVFVLEPLLQIITTEPVVTEPVKVRELLIGQLVELAVRAGSEALADEVLQVQRRQGHVFALALDEVRERHDEAVTKMGADQVAVVDVHVIDAAARLHLRLKLLDHVSFLNEIVFHLDAGDFLEGFGHGLGLVHVGVDGLRHHVDGRAAERLGRLSEPLQLLELLLTRERARLKLLVYPLFGCLFQPSRIIGSASSADLCLSVLWLALASG